jgi:hypothetical protein
MFQFSAFGIVFLNVFGIGLVGGSASPIAYIVTYSIRWMETQSGFSSGTPLQDAVGQSEYLMGNYFFSNVQEVQDWRIGSMTPTEEMTYFPASSYHLSTEYSLLVTSHRGILVLF